MGLRGPCVCSEGSLLSVHHQHSGSGGHPGPGTGNPRLQPGVPPASYSSASPSVTLSAAWSALLCNAPKNNHRSPFLWASRVHGSQPPEDPDQFKSMHTPILGNVLILTYSPSLSLTRPDPVLSVKSSLGAGVQPSSPNTVSHTGEPGFSAQPWLLTSAS